MSSRAIQNLFACYSEQLKNTRQPLKNLKAIEAELKSRKYEQKELELWQA